MLEELNTESPYYPTSALLDAYSREEKQVYLETCTSAFIETIFIIAKKLKQHNCQSTYGGIKFYAFCMAYPYKRVLLFPIKRNDILVDVYMDES